MPNKDFKTWKTFSWKCSFYVSAWQTRLLQVSRTTVSTGKWVNTFFFSIVFSPFFLLENNSKQTNCEKAEDPSVQPFSVFTCFVFFGTCRVKPAAFAARLSDEQRADVHYDIIRREWDVWVHSARQDAPINRQRGQSERVEGHSVQQRRISRHSGNKQHPRQPDAVPPAHHHHIAITLSFFFKQAFHSFDRLYVTFMQMKKQTKKAKHGRSTGQMICCCGDINNTSGKSPTSDFSVFPMTYLFFF